MKTAIRWTTLCAVFFAFALLSTLVNAQKAPSVQGTSVADPAVPVLVTPAPAGSGFFVLNQDFSVLQHSTVDTSQNQSCAGPSIYSQTNPAARTLVTDLYNAYFSGPDSSGMNTAIDAVTPEVSCTPVQAFDYTGGLATQSVSSNDPPHGFYYLVSAYGGSQVDTLTVLDNLNRGQVSSSKKFSEETQLSLDLGGVYTSAVSDTRSSFGLTAITELKTLTSPGNLWVYYPQTKTVYKILGPGGVPLPAVTSFIIPPQTDGGGSLLLLVNQDGLTASNLNAPPQDTTPFTIIDLGQLRPLFENSPAHNTITLPFVTQIAATTSFYAMLGGAYNPLDHRVYAVVAGGTSVSNVVENVLSYDTLNPTAPAERVVADVSNVPFSLGSYPQLALNAASGMMQILTSNPSTVYSVGINGTGNTAVSVPGSTFADANFSPTYIAANPLQGETYIASSSGQVDVLTRPTTLQGGLTLTLTGPDLGYTTQEYQVTPQALWPVYDDSLATAKLTITATPVGGNPVVLATGHLADVGYPGTSFYTYTFPAAGQYTLQATAEASANYPAVTSPPLNVFVGNTGVYPTAVSLSIPATAPSTNGEASLNATVTLTGSTYGPSGQVYIQDQTGAQVGNVQLPNGVISNPITVPIVIGDGSQKLTAVYSGDEQNQSSTSTPQTITVGTVAKVTPTFTVTLPSTAKTGASVGGNVKFTSSSTTAPTGTVTIYATLAGSTTANQIATATAAAAFASAGASFSFAAPAAGSYTVFAGYGGDTNYNNAVSPNVAIAVTGATLQTTAVGIVAPATATAGTAFNVVVGFNVEGAYTTQPTGNIVLTATQAGGAAITLGTVTPAQGMAPGGANISATLPNAGSYTLNANYAGDSLYAASSNTATVTQNGFATTTKVNAGPAQKTGEAFAVNVALTSTVSTPTPTGNVVINAALPGGAPILLATIPAAQAFVAGGTTAMATLSTAGNYTLSATYAGGGAFLASMDSTGITVATPATPTAIALTTLFPFVSVGTPVSATVNLVPAIKSTTAPTGNVVVTASAGSMTTTVETLTAASAFAGSAATITPTAAGVYTITATYSGDPNYLPSTSSLSVTVNALPTPGVNLTAPSQGLVSSPVGIQLSLTDGVSGKPIVSTAAITITSTLAGATGPSTTVTGTTTNTMLTFPKPGVYTLIATFAGDSKYGPASSQDFGNMTRVTIYTQAALPSFTLAPKDPSLNASGTPLQLAPTATAALILTSVNGYQGFVTITTSETSSDSLANIAVLADPLQTTIQDANGKQIGLQTADVDLAPPSAPFSITFLEAQDGRLLSPLEQNARPLVCLLFGGVILASLRRRKGLYRILSLLCIVTMIGVGAVVLPGCANRPSTYTVTVHAHDSQTGLTQTTSFLVTVPK